MTDLLQKATAAHSSGQLKEAEAIYRQILVTDATNSDALHQLGATLLELYPPGDKSTEAIRLVQAAIQQKPSVAKYRNTLGIIYERTQQHWLAIEAFQHASSKDPLNTKVLMNLARAFKEVGKRAAAAEAYGKVVAIEPDHSVAHYKRASLLHKLGRTQEALKAYREHLRVVPGHVGATFWAAALSGAPGSEACPPSMVADLYDSYADHFEEHLVSKLGYRTPNELMDALRNVAGPSARWRRCVDLGCGTGLMGGLLRPHVELLEGVDLSSAMVAKAQAGGCYDRLSVDEIVAYLRREAGRQALGGGDVREGGTAAGAPARHAENAARVGNANGNDGKVEDPPGGGPLPGADDAGQGPARPLRPADAASGAAGHPKPPPPPASAAGHERYELLVAADVFVYIGDLRPVLEAAYQAAKPGALVAFSTERLGGPDTPPGSSSILRGPDATPGSSSIPKGQDTAPGSSGEPTGARQAGGSGQAAPGYQLQPTGRYAHGAWYAGRVAEATGWQVVHSRCSKIRENAGEPVWGDLVVLRRGP